MSTLGASPTRNAALAVGAMAVAALLGWPVREFFLRGQTDFVQLYVGAHLAGSGRLYDAEANYEWHRRLFGVRLPAVLHSRPPFYALLLKPLSWLPYGAAWRLFVALNAAAAIWVFCNTPGPGPPAGELGLLYPATYLALLWGQDVWLAAALCAAALLLMNRGRDFSAGLVFSLCAIKAHLFVLVPLALLLHRKWRVLGGGAASGAVLAALGFLRAGTGWLPAYLKVLSNPTIHRDTAGMPNLNGLCTLIGSSAWVLPALSAAVVALTAWVCLRSRSVMSAIAAVLAGSFLVSYHAYPHDAVTLLLSFALLEPRTLSLPARTVWYLTASPLPLFFVLLGPPFHALLPALLMVVLLVMASTSERNLLPAEAELVLSASR
jgi:hypothetical protein